MDSRPVWGPFLPRSPFNSWRRLAGWARVLPVLPVLMGALAVTGPQAVWAQGRAKDVAAPGTALPQPLRTVPLRYPEMPDFHWTDGEVDLGFVVDEKGRIGSVEVLRGPHPAFVDAALDALLATPYKPASHAGQPMSMRVTRRYDFKMSTGMDAIIKPGPTGPITGPGGKVRLEAAPAAQLAVWPTYPVALLRNRVQGSAKVRMSVAPDGQVQAVELLAATHPEFGQAARAMAAAWRFETSRVPGGALRSIEHEQLFSSAKSGETGVPRSFVRLLDLLAAGGAGIAGADRLDGPLQALLRVDPVLPGGESGRAVVDFYVDDTGRVLLPEVVSASGEAAGWAALTAVNRWRFLPPRQGGQATMARGRVELSWPSPRNP